MTEERAGEQVQRARMPNGAGAAAVFAAGLGSLALAVLAIVADHSPMFKRLMMFSTPTGPLSGVTTTAIGVWLLCWIGLDVAWRRRNVHGAILSVGVGLLALSFLLMFPPVGDLF